jgi:hypothetical protein
MPINHDMLLISKKITPGAAERKSALRYSRLTRSFVRLPLSEVTVVFRR